METTALACAIGAAFVTGFSKAGVPGTGILVVPLMAEAIGGRLAVGATVPLLLMGDCVAVWLYGSDCDWAVCGELRPPFVWESGWAFSSSRIVPQTSAKPDPLNVLIGVMVLLMLLFQVLREWLKDRLLPTSRMGTVITGLTAGFSTMVSNAAGPIMSIYLTASGLPKSRFMGTSAWYFLIFNLLKLPFLFWLTSSDPSHPFLTAGSFKLDAMLLPGVLIGAGAGRYMLPRLSEKLFVRIVLVLAGVAALKLILGS